MPSFDWQLFEGLPSPTPIISLEAGDHTPRTLIYGLFDTGAVITSLQSPKQFELGIRDDRCVPMALGAANGLVTWQKLTVTSGWLDGHEFRLPLTISPSLPINLFGRVGIMDLWEINLNPAALTTEMAWLGPQPPSGGRPWAASWEAYWSDLLGLGYDWSNWNANGRPGLPSYPRRPKPLN
ncbi:MAG: hypothetical protein ACREP9_11125 [Candidatus Dormibacteraceae bacterium]